MAQAHEEIRVGRRKLKLSNLEKVLYPKAGFTKAQVIDYYARIAPVLLPHLKGRPLTLKRYPNGVEGMFFYEKRCPAHRPSWVKTARVPSERLGDIEYCVGDDVETLVWAANLADLELHTSLSKAARIERPSFLAFDLDPGAPAGLVECCRVALRIRELFEAMSLRCFAKTSGSKGVQVYVPLNTAVTYDETKPFARQVAELLERETPDEVTSVMSKALRPGKVFVDWSQNDEKKTTVCVYSLRAREQPTVSTPLSWDEVEHTASGKRKKPLAFVAAEVLERVERDGDLFKPVLTLRQKLPSRLH